MTKRRKSYILILDRAWQPYGDQAFFFDRGELNMPKDFKKYHEQINILKTRGLKFNDEIRALEILKRENYYNVINGYKDLFLLNSGINEQYKEGTTFEEIYSLYVFDRELRNIFIKKILIFENSFKSIIAYEFSALYGHNDYLQRKNFKNNTMKEKIKAIRLIGEIHSDINKQLDNKGIVSHYLDTHDCIPLWVLIKIFTLGRVNKFYSCMRDKEKDIVARELAYNYRLNSVDIEAYTRLITVFRNLCAHEERMYNYRALKNGKQPIDLPETGIHKILNIQGDRNGLFDVIVCLKYLLKTEDFQKLFLKITEVIKNLSYGLNSVDINDVLKKMNFPTNWENIEKI